jgi:Na+/phosphate symporter
MVRSGWGWRAQLLLALIAIGAAIIFITNHLAVLAALWVVIGVGWFAIAMWLWRQHAKATR